MRLVSISQVLCIAGALFFAGTTAAFGASDDELFDLALSAQRNIAAGRYDDGLRALDRAMKTYPKSPNLDLIYALNCRAYAGKKAFDQAVAFCSAAILRNPNNPAYFADRAEAYYWTGDRVSARKDIDAALSLGANQANVYGLKARLFWEEGNIAEAKTACWMANRLDPRQPNARFVLAAILSGKKPPKPATPSVAPAPRAVRAAALGSDEIVPKPKPTQPSVSLILDCRTPTTGTAEPIICRDGDLRYRERTLYHLYERAFSRAANQGAMDDAQRDWIAGTRNTCKTKDCLRQAYGARSAVLNLWLAD